MQPLAADAAGFSFQASCKAVEEGIFLFPAAYKAADASVFDFFAAYEAASSFEFLTRLGIHKEHVHFNKSFT